MFKIETVASLIAMLLISGCSAFSVGQEDFVCPGKEKGARCMSARGAYKATNNTDEIKANYTDDGKLIKTSGKSSGKTSDQGMAVAITSVPANERTVVPMTGNVIPLRTPSGIMRIWVNGWENESGTFESAQLVFTEVDQRRWSIGETYVHGTEPLRPLQVSTARNSLDQQSDNDQRPSDQEAAAAAIASPARSMSSPPLGVSPLVLRHPPGSGGQ